MNCGGNGGLQGQIRALINKQLCHRQDQTNHKVDEKSDRGLWVWAYEGLTKVTNEKKGPIGLSLKKSPNKGKNNSW